ncbi:MAG: hypothetical protein KGI38_12125 [Thaumarchaeota archaeon]|nr:hypothetical protein [Nitrososphaerota archaeon]
MKIERRRGASGKKWAGIAIVAVMAGGSLVYVIFPGLLSSFILPGSALPSFEGPHFIFVGVQFPGSNTVYVANANASSLCLQNSAQCSFVQSVGSGGAIANINGIAYSWMYDQTHTTLTMNEYGCNPTSVDIKPAIQSTTQISTIHYILKSSGYYATGAVNENTAQLALFTQGDIHCQFKGVTLWFAIFDAAWNNVNENGPANGATWSAPLLNEFLGAATPPNQGGTAANNYQTNPGTTSGIEPITMYSVPQTTSAFGNLLGSPSGAYALNSSLAQQGVLYPGPDRGMIPYGFFPVVLTDFGPFGCGNFYSYECDNTLQLSFNQYTLTMGTYTWANPVTSTQTTNTNNCGSNCPNTLAGFTKWLESPYGILSIIFLAVVVLVVLYIAVKLVQWWVKEDT